MTDTITVSTRCRELALETNSQGTYFYKGFVINRWNLNVINNFICFRPVEMDTFPEEMKTWFELHGVVFKYPFTNIVPLHELPDGTTTNCAEYFKTGSDPKGISDLIDLYWKELQGLP